MKARRLTESQRDDVEDALCLIRAVGSDDTDELLKWLDGLKTGLAYFGFDEKREHALEELDTFHQKRAALYWMWQTGTIATARMTSSPTDWAEGLACLEGGPHRETNALQYVAENLASRRAGTPKDITLGVYAISQLYQTDRIVRSMALEFITTIREATGREISDTQDRLFGPHSYYGLSDLVDTSPFWSLRSQLDDIRDEDGIAAMRARCALSLWQTYQLAAAQDDLSDDARQTMNTVERLSSNTEDYPEFPPLDLDERVSALLRKPVKGQWPMMDWSVCIVPTLWSSLDGPSPTASAGIHAIHHYQRLSRSLLAQIGAVGMKTVGSPRA